MSSSCVFLTTTPITPLSRKGADSCRFSSTLEEFTEDQPLHGVTETHGTFIQTGAVGKGKLLRHVKTESLIVECCH